MTVRVAMWSGPRNISTALMRSFGSRVDCVVVDEPLYAHYLDRTGLAHPGRDEVLGSQPTDWKRVVTDLDAELPVGAEVQYEKHMAHHLLPEVGRGWLDGRRNAYLIRHPAAVVASYAAVRGDVTLTDLGYPQQAEIFAAYGGPVIDAADVLREPAGTLTALCRALGIPYEPAMLEWKCGPRATDGVWAKHWYATVEASTGFGPYVSTDPPVPERLAPLLDAALPYYEQLAAHRL